MIVVVSSSSHAAIQVCMYVRVARSVGSNNVDIHHNHVLCILMRYISLFRHILQSVLTIQIGELVHLQITIMGTIVKLFLHLDVAVLNMRSSTQ